MSNPCPLTVVNTSCACLSNGSCLCSCRRSNVQNTFAPAVHLPISPRLGIGIAAGAINVFTSQQVGSPAQPS